MQTYISTRGAAPTLNFSDVLLTGLAVDGGLYVPETVPQIDTNGFETLSYKEVAKRVLSPFLIGTISQDTIDQIIEDAYSTFHHKDIAPLKKLEEDLYVFEQFHGPTLAFKDFALQFLGLIFDAVLESQNKYITIVGATSGDTGSAAIEGCRGRSNMDIFILYPHGRVSDVQRRQMTTVSDSNVHNIALKGSFDDCQNIVKTLFGDLDFRHQVNMSAVNSINWARIMAQIVYYFFAASRVGGEVSFSVPTGNFGNIYAGYLAQKMGAPIDKLIVATNKNDILHRFFETGVMSMEPVNPSLSPSMDIQISSNFERLLFDVYSRDAIKTAEAMRVFKATGRMDVQADLHREMCKTFKSMQCDDAQTLATMRDIYARYDYLVDPHTATGIYAAQHLENIQTPIICMATADPAKFPDAGENAVGVRPELPPHLVDLFEREEHFDILDNNVKDVKDFILSKRISR